MGVHGYRAAVVAVAVERAVSVVVVVVARVAWNEAGSPTTEWTAARVDVAAADAVAVVVAAVDRRILHVRMDQWKAGTVSESAVGQGAVRRARVLACRLIVAAVAKAAAAAVAVGVAVVVVVVAAVVSSVVL